MAILQPKCTAPSRAAHQVQRFLQLSVDRKRILELGLGNFNHVTRDNRSNTYNAEPPRVHRRLGSVGPAV